MGREIPRLMRTVLIALALLGLLVWFLVRLAFVIAGMVLDAFVTFEQAPMVRPEWIDVEPFERRR
jgi:hypothetical protein